MAHKFSEDGLVEFALQECLEELGWTVLTDGQKRDVRTVAEDLLAELKRDALNVDRWRGSHQVSAGVRTAIHDRLLYLPPAVYTDAEVSERSGMVYQRVWSRYGGSR